MVFFLLCANFRWEDELADRVQYDASGNIKTEIVKTPFVQVPTISFYMALVAPRYIIFYSSKEMRV